MERKSIDQMWGLPLRKVNNRIWFFDKSGVCQSLLFDDFIKQYSSRLKELHTYLYKWSTINLTDYNVYNMSMEDWYTPRHRIGMSIRSAGTYLEVGDTLDDYYRYLDECINYYDVIYQLRKAQGRSKPLPEGLNRFITKIDKPTFIRFPENPNKHTFDMIRVIVYTVTTWNTSKQQYFNKNFDEIREMVCSKLESSRTFVSYGVPIGCLAITDVLKNEEANSYEFIFELKQSLQNMAASE